MNRSIIVLAGLLACAAEAKTITIGEVTVEECTAKEVAFYERMGWDSFECHMDKAWLPDSFDLEACGVTMKDDMEVAYYKLSRCTINDKEKP